VAEGGVTGFRPCAPRDGRKSIAGDHRERDEHEGDGRAEAGDHHHVQPFATASELLHLCRRAKLDSGEEVLDRGHDLGFGEVVLLAVQELPRQVHVRRAHESELSPSIEKLPLDRVHSPRLEGNERVGASLGLLQERELLVGESRPAHELLEGHRRLVAPRRLAPGDHEVPVDVAVVEGARRRAVPDGEDPIEVGAVARLPGDGVEPRHARQVIGALAQLVRQLVRLVAAHLCLRDVRLRLHRLRHHVQAAADEDEDRYADDQEPCLDGHATSTPMSWETWIDFLAPTGGG